MDKEFMQYVYARCEKALVEDTEYMKLQSEHLEAIANDDLEMQDELHDNMDARAEEVCYTRGFKDAMALIRCS